MGHGGTAAIIGWMPPLHVAEPHAFVLCSSYHGATLLAMLLNAHPDVVHLGDTNPTTRFDQDCSCGRTVGTCPFWVELRAQLSLGDLSTASNWLPKVPPFTTSPRVNAALAKGFTLADRLSGRQLDRRVSQRVAWYRDAYQRLMTFTKDATGARVFVDGEKMVDKAVLLASASPGSTRLIHLTRDPRGYVASHLRRGRGDMLSWARDWRRYHERVRLGRWLLGGQDTLTLRYEDLAEDTQGSMDRVFRYLRVTPLDLEQPLQSPGERHVIGNRMVRTFDGRVRIDERWRDELSEADANAILRESGHFARAMGYR